MLYLVLWMIVWLFDELWYVYDNRFMRIFLCKTLEPLKPCSRNCFQLYTPYTISLKSSNHCIMFSKLFFRKISYGFINIFVNEWLVHVYVSIWVHGCSLLMGMGYGLIKRHFQFQCLGPIANMFSKGPCPCWYMVNETWYPYWTRPGVRVCFETLCLC